MDRSYRSERYKTVPVFNIINGWKRGIKLQSMVHVIFRYPPQTKTIQENVDFMDTLRDVEILKNAYFFPYNVTPIMFR